MGAVRAQGACLGRSWGLRSLSLCLAAPGAVGPELGLLGFVLSASLPCGFLGGPVAVAFMDGTAPGGQVQTGSGDATGAACHWSTNHFRFIF